MKTLNAIVKILTALAAVAGAVYVVATYGDQIVAWAKKLWASMPKCPCYEEAAPVAEEAPVEEAAPAGEAPVVEEPAEEEPAVEVTVEDTAPVAEEADFEA